MAADDLPDMGAEKGAFVLMLKLKDENPDKERTLVVEADEEATTFCCPVRELANCIGGRDVIAGIALKPRIDGGGLVLSVVGKACWPLGEPSPRSDASDARRELG